MSRCQGDDGPHRTSVAQVPLRRRDQPGQPAQASVLWAGLAAAYWSLWGLLSAMFTAFQRLVRQLVPGATPGSSLFASRDGSGKRSRWEGSYGSEHTVIYLLLQGGHINARGLATLSCVSRSFRSACENESLWHLAATLQWPSMNAADVEAAVQNSGGYRRLYSVLFSPKVGDLQLSVPLNQSVQLLEDVVLFVDLDYKGASVFSKRFNGKTDLPQLQQADAVNFQPQDIEVGSVLVDGRPVLSRRALERCARDLHASCIAMRTRDNKLCLLLDGKMNSSGMIGGSVYANISSVFALPGIFHMTCLTVDIIATVTSRLREVERREDPAAANHAAVPAAFVPAATAAPGPAPAVAPAAPGNGPETPGGAPPGPPHEAGAGGAAQARGDAEAEGTAAAGPAPPQPVPGGAAGPGRGERQRGAGFVEWGAQSRTPQPTRAATSAAESATGGPDPAPGAGAGRGAGAGAGDAGPGQGAAGGGHGHAAAQGAPAPAAAAGAAAAQAAVNAAAAAAVAGGGAGAAAPNTDTLLDVVLGALSFQIKVQADQGDVRRSKRDPKWMDLKWK